MITEREIARDDVVLITGVSGRIGSTLVNTLGESCTIVGLDLQKKRSIPPHLDFVQCDLTKDDSVKKGLAYVREKYGDQISSIVHLAAYYSFSGKPSDLYEELTVKGTERLLLKAARELKTEQFIFASTMLVHEPTKPGVKINEDSKVETKWAYPESKVKAEAIMRKEKGPVSIVILRIAGCYDDACHSIPISQQASRIFARSLEAHVFPGDITHGASYLHLDDLSDAIIQAIKRRASLPQDFVVLIGEPVTFSYDQLQREISKFLSGHEITTYQIPKGPAELGAWFENHIPFMEKPFTKPWMIPIADGHYELDITRARKELGWEPKKNVKEMIPVMLGVLKTDPKKWYKIQGIKPPHWLA
ncbi:MAG: NAD-dependent epimerase/dehydratase family protein [Candidatus Methylomirabilales bacterium]